MTNLSPHLTRQHNVRCRWFEAPWSRGPEPSSGASLIIRINQASIRFLNIVECFFALCIGAAKMHQNKNMKTLNTFFASFKNSLFRSKKYKNPPKVWKIVPATENMLSRHFITMPVQSFPINKQWPQTRKLPWSSPRASCQHTRKI